MSAAPVDYKAAIGASVARRLARNPMGFKIPSADIDIFVIRDFLTAKECAGLVRLIDRERIPSRLLAPSSDPDFRTSESCNLSPNDPLVMQVESKISALTGIEPDHGETIQGQRYAVGQQFKPHHDYFHRSEAYWEEMDRCGGQRTWTAMAFLNVPEEGGATFFPRAGIKVTPRLGNLLVWNNLDADGLPNPATLHQGMPVIAGTKYIVTKWHRERPWIVSTATYY
jgi:prolyl 4-hydroxylase